MPNVVLKGPIFDDDAPAELKEGVLDGLKELAIEVVADVQTQLTPGQPPHGFVTGRLRGSIGFKELDGPGYVVESGATSGAPVPYAYWIETGMRGGRRLWSGYGMFEQARNRLRGNQRHVDDVISKAIVKKMGGRGLI